MAKGNAVAGRGLKHTFSFLASRDSNFFHEYQCETRRHVFKLDDCYPLERFAFRRKNYFLQILFKTIEMFRFRLKN